MIRACQLHGLEQFEGMLVAISRSLSTLGFVPDTSKKLISKGLSLAEERCVVQLFQSFTKFLNFLLEFLDLSFQSRDAFFLLGCSIIFNMVIDFQDLERAIKIIIVLIALFNLKLFFGNVRGCMPGF